MTEEQRDAQLPLSPPGKAAEHCPDVPDPPLPWLIRRLQQIQSNSSAETSDTRPKTRKA